MSALCHHLICIYYDTLSAQLIRHGRKPMTTGLKRNASGLVMEEGRIEGLMCPLRWSESPQTSYNNMSVCEAGAFCVGRVGGERARAEKTTLRRWIREGVGLGADDGTDWQP